MDKTPEISKNTFTFGKNKQNQENDAGIDDDDFNIEEDQCVQYEGYVKFFLQKFCRFGKKQYLCTRFREKIKRWH